MYIKDYMTQDPFCIPADTSVSKALDIMSGKDFHRLPVTDASGKLIGLVTEGLIAEGSGKNTTSLSIYELNYLLSKTKVSELMITDVKTIGPDALVEEAAEKMKQNSIHVLPVVDSENKVIGIITENDIFKAFMDLLGHSINGTRFVIHIQEDHTGVLEDLCGVFAKENVSLANLAVYHNQRGIEVVVLAKSEAEFMKAKLEEKGYQVTDMRTNKKA